MHVVKEKQEMAITTLIFIFFIFDDFEIKKQQNVFFPSDEIIKHNLLRIKVFLFINLKHSLNINTSLPKNFFFFDNSQILICLLMLITNFPLSLL